MSDTLAGLIAFLAWLVFICFFVRLWTQANLSPPSKLKTAREALRQFKRASNWHDRLAVIFFYSPILFSLGFGSILTALITAGFACLGAIFGSNVETLQLLRKMPDSTGFSGKISSF